MTPGLSAGAATPFSVMSNERQAQPRLQETQVAAGCGTLVKIDMKI